MRSDLVPEEVTGHGLDIEHHIKLLPTSSDWFARGCVRTRPPHAHGELPHVVIVVRAVGNEVLVVHARYGAFILYAIKPAIVYLMTCVAEGASEACMDSLSFTMCL